MTQAAELHVELNGVDVTSLTGIIGGISAEPALGHCQFRASKEWLRGAHNRSRIESRLAGDLDLRGLLDISDAVRPG